MMISLLPVTTQSTPVKGADAAVSPSVTEKGRRATSSKIPVSWEKSPHAIGDANKRPTTPAGKLYNLFKLYILFYALRETYTMSCFKLDLNVSL